jgi:hypothetical protein
MRAPRPAFVDVTVHEDATTVTLAWQGVPYVGSAGGTTQRAVGEATLDAVDQLTDGKVVAKLVAVAATDLGESTVAMAQAELAGEELRLVGSALIREGSLEAATVRAVLDAVNRTMSLHL